MMTSQGKLPFFVFFAARRRRASRHFVAALAAVVLSSALASQSVFAQTLPAPPTPVALPNPSTNAFGVSVAFGPTNGLMYVWDGQNVLKQNSFNSSGFTSIGSVPAGNSSDAGPIAFSRDGSQILLGNGAGGLLGGAFAGSVFDIPAGGGTSGAPVGNVPFHDAFLAAPLGASNSQYFVDQGNAAFTASSVSVFDESTGVDVSVIKNIPGASSSVAIDNGRLFVGIGFGPEAGELRSFALSDLATANMNHAPLDWTSGTLFNSANNNSGAGMFFDSRGFLFVGGPNGLTVFDKQGDSSFYGNNGFTSVTYDPLDDRLLVTGFGDQQGIYPASMFAVPEPSTVILAIVASGLLLPLACRRRGDKSRR